jgi:hypothetical protein
LRVEPKALWAEAFRQTYRAEWRFEPRQRHRELLADDPDYYRCATEGALKRLGSRGLLEHRGDRVEPDPEWVRRSRRAWALRRPASKAIAAARLIKSALIFGDWVPYALWKMERHTGVHLEASAAQRRHPFLLGWPLIFRALRERLLR